MAAKDTTPTPVTSTRDATALEQDPSELNACGYFENSFYEIIEAEGELGDSRCATPRTTSAPGILATDARHVRF